MASSRKMTQDEKKRVRMATLRKLRSLMHKPRRKSVKPNPSTTTTLLILGGVLAAGGVAYYLYSQSKKPAAPATPPAVTPPVTPGTPAIPGVPALQIPAGLPADMQQQLQTILANATIPANCKQSMLQIAPAMATYMQNMMSCTTADTTSPACKATLEAKAQIDKYYEQLKASGCDKYMPQG